MILLVLTLPEHSWPTAAYMGAASGPTIGAPLIVWFLSLQSALGRRLRRLPLAANFVLIVVVIAALLWAPEFDYLGDTVNTAARIAGECRQHQRLWRWLQPTACVAAGGPYLICASGISTLSYEDFE